VYGGAAAYSVLSARNFAAVYKTKKAERAVKKSWLLRPAASICAALSLLVFSVVIAFNRGGDADFRDSLAYTVTIKHYGVNAREMERTVSIPLEDAMYSIDNIKNIVTVSENGRARAFIILKKNRKGIFYGNKSTGIYEAVSEAAQRVYETLPSSAQRPEIISASESRIPVWTAAVTSPGDVPLNTFIERTVKPSLSAVDGAAEVEISGTGINEIVIALKPEAASAAGITAPALADFLSRNDRAQNSGTIRVNDRDILVTADGRYKNIEELGNAIIPLVSGAYIRLKQIADVFEHEREPDVYSRVNGRKTAVISVLPQSDASWGRLSRLIKKEITALEKHNIKFNVLSDLGKEESDAYKSVFFASLQGSLFVSIIAALLSFGGKGKSKWKTGLICALSVPYICVLSAAVLVIFGLPLDKILLAGLASGTGAAVDTAILCGEKLNNIFSPEEARLKLRELKSPVISGSLTTIISLVPLVTLPFASDDILKIAYAICAVNFVSLVMALTILPPLFLRKKNTAEDDIKVSKFDAFVRMRIENYLRRIRGFSGKALLHIIRLCVNYPLRVCIPALVLTAVGIAAIVLSGTDTGASSSEGTVFVQIEYDGGILTEKVDNLLSTWAEQIKINNGIINVQTSSRISHASALINFDPKLITAEEAARLARTVDAGGGFVYITQSVPGQRTWNIQFSGSDDMECRRIAREAASLCRVIQAVEDVVLNFKDGSNNITIKPDRKKLAELGTNVEQSSIFSILGAALRWGVHGPVAYKRIAPESAASGETDVRVRAMGNGIPSRKDIENLPLNLEVQNAQSGYIRLNSLVNIEEGKEPSGIRRDGRRRTASISIRTKVVDARRVRDLVMPMIEKIKMPDTYSAEFDREAVENSDAIRNSIYYFLAAIIFCYMIIAAVNESFVIPLMVLAVVPPSLSIPVIFLILSGSRLNAAIVCSLIAVCGVTVNSAVITAGAVSLPSRRRCGGIGDNTALLYQGIKKVIPLIAGTGLTTVISAVPFLFLREGSNELVRSLSVITVFGAAASCVFSISLVPALAVVIQKNNFKRVPRSGT
jgi:multidrug efflux pump subunit AcrB